MKLAIFSTLVLSLGISAFAENKPIDAFPREINGKERHVIYVPEVQKTNGLLVDLNFSIVLKDSDCNYKSLLGQIEEKNLEGWGYTYFEVMSDGNYTSTRMFCGDETTKEEAIYAYPPKYIDYNPRMPIVVYAPKNIFVNYRIFEAKSGYQVTGEKIAK
jgi:ecotin